MLYKIGTLGGIRTLDPRLRRPLLYPTELQAYIRCLSGIEPELRETQQNTDATITSKTHYGGADGIETVSKDYFHINLTHAY